MKSSKYYTIKENKESIQKHLDNITELTKKERKILEKFLMTEEENLPDPEEDGKRFWLLAPSIVGVSEYAGSFNNTKYPRNISDMLFEAWASLSNTSHAKAYRLGKLLSALQCQREITDFAKEMLQSDLARAAAFAKNAKDPRQKAKYQVRECWLLWKKEPTRYQSKSAFARDMLDKFPDLVSQKVITDRWCKEWACPAPPDRSDGMIMLGEQSDGTKQKTFHGRVQARGGAAG